MQRAVMVLPFLGQVLIRVRNGEFPIYGPNDSIQILGGRDLDLVDKVY